MATIKGIYRVLNYQGTYDEIHLKTDASQVIESDLKSFVSITEKTAWNNKSDIGHKHTSNDISDATDANTAGKIIKRDSNGDFSARNMKGNAYTATVLQTARKINGVSFDGSTDITITAKPTGHTHTSSEISDATNLNSPNKVVKRNVNGDFSAGTITANLSGNASSATKLETARTINGIPFDGTNNITINAIPTSHNHDDLYKRKSEDYRITPKLLSKGQDLNLLYVSGHYVSGWDSNSVTILNRPPGSMGFSLEVRNIVGLETSAGRTIQIATMRENNEVYIRNKEENASWTNWIKQWNSNNLVFGNGSEQMARGNHTHNYLSSNGGIINGNVTFSADNTGFNMYGGARIYKKQGAGLRLVPHIDNIGVTITDKSDTVDVLNVKLDSFTYKGNKVYHYGDKPKPSEIGAAEVSHKHNYVPISSGGNITIHADSDASSTAEYVYLKAGHNILQVTSSGGGNTVTKGNDKLTFNGDKVYHAGNKPTPEEIGAAKATHGNHVPNKQSANNRVFLRNDNTWQALPNATINQTGIVQLTDSTSSQSTTTAATANSVKIAYDLANSKASSAHGHHNISSRGSVAMETGLNRPTVAGLSMSEVLNNGYPTTYGNVMTMRGRGDGQLLIGWPGTSGGHAPAYIRSKRDVGDAEWSQWAQIYTTANKPTLTDLGISTLNRGAYLTGSNYNGMTAVTWAVDATTTATPNKIAARDNSADISARLFRSSYPNDTTISGAMAFRINNAGNNYIRFCSDTEAIRTFLSTYSKSQTYSRSEMDNRYRQKADLVFTNTISIVTPAA